MASSVPHVMYQVCGTADPAGDTTIIAAPASGSHLVISTLILQNTTAVATTALVKAGSAVCFRVLAQNQGDGLILSFPAGREFVLPNATALIVNLSGANSFGYSVHYRIE